MLEHNQDRVYTLDELVFINNIDLNGMKDYMQTKSLKFKSEVYNKVMGQECSIFEAWNYYRVVTPIEILIKYRQVMYMQMLKGEYAEEGNLAGTLGELGLAFTGLDVFLDVRDLSHDVIYWENNWEHVLGTVGNAVGLVPVVGILSKSDEILAVIKRGDRILELRKFKYAKEVIENLKELKYITKAQELANTAGIKLQNFGANLYRNILNICEGVPNYRLAYATAGSYDNPVISALSKNADDLKYLESVDEDLVEEVVWEVAGSGSRNADELEALTEEAVEKAKKKAGDIVEGGLDIRVKPSRTPDILAKPGGKRTVINYADPDPDNIRALIRENEAADTLARQGYVVEQNPIVPGSKNPDYLIEGVIFDCYSPKDGTSVRNIASGIKRKIDEGQTNRIILNLDDWHGGGGSIEDLIKQLNDWPIDGLEEVKVINQYHEVIDIYP